MSHRTTSICTSARLAVLGLLTACAQVEPRADFDKARGLITDSTGREEVFDPYAEPLARDELDALLADGLTLDEALRIALLNNRELRADFQEIGSAHTDVVQAQLLSNPTLDLLLRFPADGGRSLLEAILGLRLLELWRIPVRTEVARQELEATVLRIARRAGERLADARNAYHAAVAAEELLRVAEENVELATRSHGAVRELHAAGAADAFDENLARGPLLAAQLAVRTGRIDAANAKRELAKHLSLARPGDTLWLTDALPEPLPEPLPGLLLERAPTELDAEALVERALGSRLDLRAIEATLAALEASVRLEGRKGLGEASAGPALERPAGSGENLVGPSVSLTLPLFDTNRAGVARAEFELEQLRALYEAARVAIAQDVRSSADRWHTSRTNLAFYDEDLLPQAQRSLELARESYSVGHTTLLALVEVQRQLLEARRGHVLLRLEAAKASSELERVVGLPLRDLVP